MSIKTAKGLTLVEAVYNWSTNAAELQLHGARIHTWKSMRSKLTKPTKI